MKNVWGQTFFYCTPVLLRFRNYFFAFVEESLLESLDVNCYFSEFKDVVACHKLKQTYFCDTPCLSHMLNKVQLDLLFKFLAPKHFLLITKSFTKIVICFIVNHVIETQFNLHKLMI